MWQRAHFSLCLLSRQALCSSSKGSSSSGSSKGSGTHRRHTDETQTLAVSALPPTELAELALMGLAQTSTIRRAPPAVIPPRAYAAHAPEHRTLSFDSR